MPWAHAPQGQPAQRWPVGFSFGQAIEKAFQVCGPRRHARRLQWDDPEAAAQVPIRYEQAFGGPHLLQAEETLQRLAQDPALRAEQRQQATQALARVSGQIGSITGRLLDVPACIEEEDDPRELEFVEECGLTL